MSYHTFSVIMNLTLLSAARAVTSSRRQDSGGHTAHGPTSQSYTLCPRISRFLRARPTLSRTRFKRTQRAKLALTSDGLSARSSSRHTLNFHDKLDILLSGLLVLVRPHVNLGLCPPLSPIAWFTTGVIASIYVAIVYKCNLPSALEKYNLLQSLLQFLCAFLLGTRQRSDSVRGGPFFFVFLLGSLISTDHSFQPSKIHDNSARARGILARNISLTALIRLGSHR